MGNVVRLYGVGGCGLNLCTQYIGRDDTEADIQIALVDTSKANLRNREVGDVPTYLIKGLDGSGKIQGMNVDEIRKNNKQILIDIPPGDFNIVVTSLSGGSGAVIANFLVRELLDRKAPTVVVAVGNVTNGIEAHNTRNALKSLEIAAVSKELPVVLSYHENSIDVKRSDVDKDIFGVLSSLVLLASGENEALDTADVQNWLQYTKVPTLSHLEPRLVTLHVTTSNDALMKVPSPLSIASILASPDSDRATINAGYVTEGFGDLARLNIEALHLAITNQHLSDVYDRVDDMVRKMQEAQSATIAPSRIVSESDLGEYDDIIV